MSIPNILLSLFKIVLGILRSNNFLPPPQHLQTPPNTDPIQHRNPGSLICHITHGLLQCPPHWTPHQTHQQTANHSELSRPDHYPHQISWPHHPVHPTPLAPGTIPHPLQKPPPHLQSSQQPSPHLPLWPPSPIHSLPSLRSTSAGLLTIPTSRLSTMGDPPAAQHPGSGTPSPTHQTVRHHHNLQVTTPNSPVQTGLYSIYSNVLSWCFVFKCLRFYTL